MADNTCTRTRSVQSRESYAPSLLRLTGYILHSEHFISFPPLLLLTRQTATTNDAH